MVAILVLATFIIFVLVDYYWQRRQEQPAKIQVKAENVEELPFPMSVVGGFKVPAHLSYHPGHTWAIKEARQVVRIGLDDFAVRLIGQVDKIALPARGRWLRQGEHAWVVERGGHSFEMLSPIEGEIVDVNEEVVRDPSIAHKDPYGAGWLLEVNAPAADANLKNLLRGRLAHRWMEEAVSSLHTWVSPGAGAHLQDGGHAVDDVFSQIPEPRWEKVAREMFLG